MLGLALDFWDYATFVAPVSSRRRLPWARALGLTLTLVLALGGEALPGADSPKAPPQSPAAAPARSNEIKLFVTAANAEQVIAALELDEHRAEQEIVCFFDTSSGTLESHDLILRARQIGCIDWWIHEFSNHHLRSSWPRRCH